MTPSENSLRGILVTRTERVQTKTNQTHQKRQDLLEVLKHKPTLVERLLQQGVMDTTVTDFRGQNALHVACLRPRQNGVSKTIECVDALVHYCPQLLEGRDNLGQTPLFKCLWGHNKDRWTWALTTRMIELGADVSVMDNQRQTLAHILIQKVIRQENAFREDILHYYLPNRFFETTALIRLLVNLHPEMLEHRNKEGHTPFMAACFWGNLDLIFFFLKEHGAIRDLLLPK